MHQIETCELCGVKDKLTKHHLIPQVKYTIKLKKKNKNNFNIKNNLTILICSLCHTTLHAKFSENELRDNLNTIDKILANEEFQKYLTWRKKHMNFKTNSTKLSNSNF